MYGHDWMLFFQTYPGHWSWENPEDCTVSLVSSKLLVYLYVAPLVGSHRQWLNHFLGRFQTQKCDYLENKGGYLRKTHRIWAGGGAPCPKAMSFWKVPPLVFEILRCENTEFTVKWFRHWRCDPVCFLAWNDAQLNKVMWRPSAPDLRSSVSYWCIIVAIPVQNRGR